MSERNPIQSGNSVNEIIWEESQCRLLRLCIIFQVTNELQKEITILIVNMTNLLRNLTHCDSFWQILFTLSVR